jgi:hypothetical protein
VIEFAKLIENATDLLEEAETVTSAQKIEIAKVYAILALAIATRGG